MGSKHSVTLIFIRIVVLHNLLLWPQLGSGATFNYGNVVVPSGGHDSISSLLCSYQCQRLQWHEEKLIRDIIELQSIKLERKTFVNFKPNISCSGNKDAQIKCFCDNTGDCFINEIDFSDNQLIGNIPPSLRDLKELVYLNLSNNKLTGPIPVPMILPKLEYLDLSNNRLTGPIPKSLGDCKTLQYISLEFNFLAGSIPERLGALSSTLTYLSLWFNLLSGQIPAALGNLHNLTVLALDENNLSGGLPPDLGNLVNLQELWLTSNNFTGIIPRQYGKLRNLTAFSVGGNNLSGAIPDYIENWTNLIYLNLVGNNFKGNLPGGIFNLPNLTILEVSDISNPGISFPDQAKLPSIIALMLRNCSINGSIPHYFGDWNQLKALDLSFNNLVNGIPDSFKNLSILVLARNNLSGPLPFWITSNQTHPKADLTYNDFNGSCSNETSYGISSDVKILPTRTCISQMKATKCDQKHDSLSINCGGKQVKTDKHLYLKDTAKSNFYPSSTDQWTYSFSGDYYSTDVRASHGNVSCGCVSVPEGNIYTDFRIAPVSLTYYALCLDKGQYNVTLLFAETLYSKKDDNSIKGKRVFDVYSQGFLILKDLNIKAEAGEPNKALKKYFTATVGKDGVLEIHFYWAGKGSQYNPPFPGQGPLISAISINRQVSKKKLSALHIAGITVGCALFLLLMFAFMWRMGWIGDREFRKKEIKLGERAFSPKEIIDASQKFSPNVKLGEGRLGTVFKAELTPDLTIAVKKLRTPSTPKEKEEFAKAMDELANEVYAMTHLDMKNENLVQLLAGYSKKGLHLLIYEYMELKSLGKALFDPNSTLQLNWPTRYNICRGIAKGLKHLHERPQQIIHRNIKANNILLDANYNAKISDFGLAKLYQEENPYSFIEVGKDTASYMAPEYATRKAVSIKIDVYSFGVLLLEVVSGRKNAEYRENQEFVFLLDTACNLHARGRLIELIDERSRPYDWDQANTILKLAMMCVDLSPSLRPTMSQVVSVLEGEKHLEEITKEITHSTT